MWGIFCFCSQILKCISQLELAQLIGTGVRGKHIVSTQSASPRSSHQGVHHQGGHHNDLFESNDGNFVENL